MPLDSLIYPVASFMFCVSVIKWSVSHVLFMCHLCLLLQQLMRERQQMASRPFASVAVSLDARGELTEVLQPVVDVSPHCLLKQRQITHRCFASCFFQSVS